MCNHTLIRRDADTKNTSTVSLFNNASCVRHVIIRGERYMTDMEIHSEYGEVLYSSPLHIRIFYGFAIPVFESI
jgi:hypothetical protein